MAQHGETGLTATWHLGNLDSTSETRAMQGFKARKTEVCTLLQAAYLPRCTTTAAHMVDCDSRRTSVRIAA
jgi:hypothetical protein